MNQFFDEDEIRKSLAILKPSAGSEYENELFEIRIIDNNGRIFSGYFHSADKLIECMKMQTGLRDCQVYFTLNDIKEDCYSRVQRDRLKANSKKDVSTDDKDISGYKWMLIDFDPERPTGVSSNDDEMQAAKELFDKVYVYLRDIGFEEPVKAISGNGYHLLYRVCLKNAEENTDLIKACLATLDTMFSNDRVHIDTVNYNPSRICKLYGTLAQKGADTESRPHRMSRMLSDRPVAITDKAYLEKLVAQLKRPEEQKQAYRDSDPGTRFDLIEFMRKHNITYSELDKSGRDGSTIYSLDECPFNASHRSGDAKIFSYPSGHISFKCHHNSCSGKSWQDVRLMYEPNAYNKDRPEIDREIEAGWREHNRAKHIEEQAVSQPEPPADSFRTALDIENDPDPEHEFIRSGITVIDEKMRGFEKQCLSVISGTRGSGKSTLIGMMILNAVQAGHRVVVYSGELANKKYLNWLDRQAAGKAFVDMSNKYENTYGIKAEIRHRIHEWMGDLFLLYNNDCGNKFGTLAEQLEKTLIEKKADLCIIDNMMILDLDAKNDTNGAQTAFVLALKRIAKRTNTHIVFVAHPKKSNGFIRLDDISGTGNIGNIVDNAFMVHRHDEDFKKSIAEFNRFIYKGLDEAATNFIEIAKDRENGTKDFFIPLYYEESTKRLRNSLTENIVYGWTPEIPNGYEAVNEKMPFEE